MELTLDFHTDKVYDVIIIGAGPAFTSMVKPPLRVLLLNIISN